MFQQKWIRHVDRQFDRDHGLSWRCPTTKFDTHNPSLGSAAIEFLAHNVKFAVFFDPKRVCEELARFESWQPMDLWSRFTFKEAADGLMNNSYVPLYIAKQCVIESLWPASA
jgi:hypothetical protein